MSENGSEWRVIVRKEHLGGTNRLKKLFEQRKMRSTPGYRTDRHLICNPGTLRREQCRNYRVVIGEQNFFQMGQKIAAIFRNTSVLGHRRSQDFWLGGEPTTCNDVIWNFRKKNFLLYKDIVDWKIRNRRVCLAHNQDFAKGRELKPPKKVRMCKMGDVLSKLV